MHDQQVVARILTVRATALAAGDLGVAAECDNQLARYGHIPTQAPETTRGGRGHERRRKP